MANIRLKQGDDAKITLQIIKNAVPVDLTTATNVKAVLYVGEEEKKIYSMSPSTGEGLLTLSNTTVGELSIFVERADSVSFPTGGGHINILVAFDDTEFPDSNRVETFDIKGLYVQKGDSLNVQFP